METLIKSAYTNEKYQEKLSDKYKVLQTSKIVEVAESKGWNVQTMSEASVRKENKQGYQRHLIILTKDSYITNEGKMQLAVRNSHDGTTSVQMFAGYMRVACSNQLFAKSFGNTGLEARIKHTGNG